MRFFIRLVLAAFAAAGFGWLTLAGLAGPAAAAGFENIILSASEGAEATETVFAQDTPKLFLSADITDEVASGSKLVVAWISVDSGGVAPPNYKIDEVSFDVGLIDNRLDASLSKPNAGWPVGTYQVQMIVDGTVEETVDFEVK
jgi:hypothetical protein